MRYRIEYADGRYCNFANGRAELLNWLIKAVCRIPSWKHTGIISVQHKEGAYGYRYRKTG